MLASMLWPCAAQCVTPGGNGSEKGAVMWYYSKTEAPDIHQRWQLLNLKTWRYRISRGIKKPWQINHGQAGIPLPQLTDISFYGHFANKV